jgi:hypothetical protein
VFQAGQLRRDAQADSRAAHFRQRDCVVGAIDLVAHAFLTAAEFVD